MSGVIKQLEQLVKDNPDFFDPEIKGLTPLERAYIKLQELTSVFAIKQAGIDTGITKGKVEDLDRAIG